MPHSGGGGSHGGGSHGGSHSHHSSGSGGSSRRVGSTGFAGASRYVYYVGHKPNYVYANYDITKKSDSSLWIQIIVLIPFLLIPLLLLFTMFNAKPQKLSTDYQTGYYVDDRIGIIQDDSTLLNRMDVFFDKTGITPVFMTVYSEEWNKYYDALENYAYDVYVNSFMDEKHMLIVYSQPKKADPQFMDWEWELMQGNDTDGILTDRIDDRFREILQKNLTNNNVSVEDAMTAAFDEINPVVMKRAQYSFGEIFAVLFFIFIWESIIVFSLVKSIIDRYGKQAKLYQSAKPCPEMVVEEACEYCTGIYVVGTCQACPHCGAPVPPHTYPAGMNAGGKT